MDRRAFLRLASGLLVAATAVEPVRRFWPGWRPHAFAPQITAQACADCGGLYELHPPRGQRYRVTHTWVNQLGESLPADAPLVPGDRLRFKLPPPPPGASGYRLYFGIDDTTIPLLAASLPRIPA